MKARKLFAIILAAVMVLGMTVSAFADNNVGADPVKGSIEIKNPQTTEAGEDVTYNAYKIFDATYNGSNYAYSMAKDSAWVNDVVAYATPTGTTLADNWKTTTANGLTVTKVVDKSGAVTSYDVTFQAPVAAVEDDPNTVEDESKPAVPGFSAPDFAKEMAKKTEGKTAVPLDDQDEDENPKAKDLELGYYMVVPSDPTLDDGKLVSLTTTDPNVTVSDKNEKPEVEKEIVEGDDSTDHNTASVGDTVPFRLTGKVPDMTGYEKYFYIVNDVMSKGLTFDAASVAITVGGEDLTAGTDYTVKTELMADGSTEIRIVFKDMVEKYSDDEGDAIVIEYNAIVNDDAVIGTVGNSNKAKVEFSNDPSIKPEYDPNNPPTDDDDPRDPNYNWNKPGTDLKNPTGEGPENSTKTYVTELDLKKVDSETKAALSGAKFKIEGESAKVVITNEEIFKESTTGTYYRLMDGTYTTAAPVETTPVADTYTEFTGDKVTYTELSPAEKPAVGLFYSTDGGTTKTEITADNLVTVKGLDENTVTLYLPTYNTLGLYTAENESSEITTEADAKAAALGTATLYTRTVNELDKSKYESTSVKYEKVEQITKTNAGETFTSEGWVDSTGKISFSGLGEGTYTITELIAPDGYNLLTEPITVVVTLVEGTPTGTYKFQAAVNGGTPVPEAAEGGIPFDVENNKGVELPETGGVGTQIFYALGSLLLVGAAVLLITKKRMSVEE